MDAENEWDGLNALTAGKMAVEGLPLGVLIRCFVHLHLSSSSAVAYLCIGL